MGGLCFGWGGKPLLKVPGLEAEEAVDSEETSSTVRHAKAAAEAAGLNLATLKLTIDVEAPIFRLEAWKDGAALEILSWTFFRELLSEK